MTNFDSKPLILAAVAGDQAATAQLLAMHRGRLAHRLRTRLELNPYADFSAEDVLQEVYVVMGMDGVNCEVLNRVDVPFVVPAKISVPEKATFVDPNVPLAVSLTVSITCQSVNNMAA